MTLRTSAALKQQRPLSAIFIGSLGSTSSSTPPDLPRLPEPPSSPGGSSDASASGLPSPPATNSTGSGSVGDDSTATAGSQRKRSSTQRPSVFSSADMYDSAQNDAARSSRSRDTSKNKHVSNSRSHSVASSGMSDEEDPPHDNDHEDDVTARFDSISRRRSGRVLSPPRTEDHSSALQRVKSLTERNRLVLNKLSSLQRVSSPVPPKSTPSPYSPPDSSPTPYTSRPSLSASRPSPSLHHHLYNTRAHSGSETEREGRRAAHSHAHSSSDSMSNTPTSTFSEISTPFAPPPDRRATKPRRLSAPSSPQREIVTERQRTRDRDASPSPSPGPSQTRTPRKRASVAVTQGERDMYRKWGEEDDRGEDLMAAALAAVASSRNAESIGASGSKGNRNASRHPLPLEFRDGDRREGDLSPPSTPRRERDFARSRRSPSPSARTAISNNSSNNTTSEQRSPRRHPAASGRTSTVREITRRHQTKWLSEDMSASHADAENEPEHSMRATTSHSHYSSPSRRQSGRPGSTGNPSSPSKRPVEDGVRSSGITKRRDAGGGGDDVFVNGHAGVSAPSAQTRRTHSSGTSSSIFSGDPNWESPVQLVPNYRLGGLPTGSSRTSDPRTPASILQRQGDRGNMYITPGARPVTSMAALHHDSPSDYPSRMAPSGPRAYRALHERDMSTSTLTLDDSIASYPDRPYTSAYTPGSGRLSVVPSAMGGSRDAHAEHRRLMLEALGMFESQLSRLPPMGQTTTGTIPEVFQSSQQLVHALDRLNNNLRTSTAGALEAQIQAEVGDGDHPAVDMSALWQEVGADHREHLRISDEIVRTTTQFLLGVGKVLRDAASTASASASSSHLRSISLDDEATRSLQAPDSSVSSEKKSSDGRRSRETRRSWDPREPNSAFKEKLANLARSNTTGSRPSSALHSLTRGSAASSGSRSTGDGLPEQTPPSMRPLTSTLTSSSSAVRRLYTPRDKRSLPETNPRGVVPMSSIDSQETLQAYEPSPTPSSRQGVTIAERPRALPPLAIPPSLPTLPSESLLRKSGPSSASTEQSVRRKVSSSSNITVRAEPSSLPDMIKPPNATTAITPATVSNASSSGSDPALSRTDSGGSARTNGVTFSRPPNVSLSTLSGLHRNGQTQISRVPSGSSTVEAPSPVALRSPYMSGSDTERPRTVAVRGRASLDGARSIVPSGSQAATLQPSRKERRRTITEIFAQVHK